MIELPEAVVLAKQLNNTILNKRIANVITNQSAHKFAWYSGDPSTYNARLSGKSIGLSTAYAGVVEIKAEDKVLLIGAPMRFHPQGDKLPAKHQLLLEFDDATALSASIQMWGCLMCFNEGENVSFEGYAPSKQVPSPLDPDFNRHYFDGLFNENTRKLSSKAFLATEQRIPGLGNGVLQDILWTAHIHPKRKMGSLSEEEQDTMFAAVKSVLQEMVECGGRDTERDLFGNNGGYKTILSKNTLGLPCPTCGTPIQKEAYMGGAIYFCAGCQSLS